MTYKCPKCKRFGMEWDGRAKVLICLYHSCKHVIHLNNQKGIPTPEEVKDILKKEGNYE